MRRVRSVGIASQPMEDTAATAVFDYAALLAARRRLERTIVTAVVSGSSPSCPLIILRVCTHSVCVQLYT